MELQYAFVIQRVTAIFVHNTNRPVIAETILKCPSQSAIHSCKRIQINGISI